jgi:hypothetical protein
VNQQHSAPVSELLVCWKAGDQEALEALVPMVYKELHDIARHHFQRDRPGHTLQSAALVHEAYLRLLDQRASTVKRDWNVAKAWLSRQMKKGRRDDTGAVAKD